MDPSRLQVNPQSWENVGVFWNRLCTCTLAELSQTGFNRRSKWKLYPYLTMNLLNWSHATGCVVFRCSLTKRKVSILLGHKGCVTAVTFGEKNTFSESFCCENWGWKQRQTHGHPGRLRRMQRMLVGCMEHLAEGASLNPRRTVETVCIWYLGSEPASRNTTS